MNKENKNRLDAWIDKAVYEKLERYCNLTGSSKTKAIEISLNKYIDVFLEKIKEA